MQIISGYAQGRKGVPFALPPPKRQARQRRNSAAISGKFSSPLVREIADKLRARERGVIHWRRNPSGATVIALRYLILIFRRSCQRRRGLKGGRRRRRLRNSLIPSSEVPPRNKGRENESHLVCIPFSARCRSRNGNFDCDYVGAQYLREKAKEGGGKRYPFAGAADGKIRRKSAARRPTQQRILNFERRTRADQDIPRRWRNSQRSPLLLPPFVFSRRFYPPNYARN